MSNSFSSVLKITFILLFANAFIWTKAQETDTLHKKVDTFALPIDTVLRIRNLIPFFTLHVDSTLQYNLEINKDESQYYWYLRNSPVGLKINKDNGMLTFKADRSFFLSGKLKYDNEYKVMIGVQNLNQPTERVDTIFSIVFYNTEIIPSRVKPTVSSVLYMDEGDTVSFKVQCEHGSFPIESITFFANTPLKHASIVNKCYDDFTWSPPFDFVKDTDSGKVKILLLNFVGANRFMAKDTATVKIIIRDALNYPLASEEHSRITRNINAYILQLKYIFLELDKSVKKNKGTRTGFDITSSSMALGGSILLTSESEATQNVGKVLPSVGVTLVPIKEAVAPQKVYNQNQASLVRTSIKRLEYLVSENSLLGEKDPDVTRKTGVLRNELKQVQVQLIEVPIDIGTNMSEEELNKYFNDPKVQKKYRLTKK